MKMELSSIGSSTESTKITVLRIMEQVRHFQDRAHKFIEDNYVDFPCNQNICDVYINEGESLIRETENLQKNIGSEASMSLNEANLELVHYLEILREVSIGLKLSHRILKIDDLFQCLDDLNATKEYLPALDLLEKLKSLICSSSFSEIDLLFQKCECYDNIKVKYHIQANILQQNLQQKFDRLVQFSVKVYPTAKYINLQVSKNLVELQSTVNALFQARYNPIKLCDFIFENCLIPIITTPVSVEYFTQNEEFNQMSISYSIKTHCSLKPSYKTVLSHIVTLFDCLAAINVQVSESKYVFGIIGNHIKEKCLNILVEKCLMHAIPETMDEYDRSTVVSDIKKFEHELSNIFFMDPSKDKALSNFVSNYDTLFRRQFSTTVLENVRSIVQRDLQDMTEITEQNITNILKSNYFQFPQCMVSKSTLDILNLLERILHQPLTMAEATESSAVNYYLTIIPTILNTYALEAPKLHEKLLESIPQQSAVFHNNCMFLSQWVVKNAKFGIPTHAALVKTLQSTGIRIFKAQEEQQRKIILDILKNLDISDTHSIGLNPLKLLRQCLRQLDLLKNVWMDVLPESEYYNTFCSLMDIFCQDIIRNILCLEDISTTVANQLGELIDTILRKGPSLFKEKNQVMLVPSWMKLQQLQMILSASLQEIADQWCDGAGILTVNFKAEEIRHLIRALFQNTDRRAKILSRIA
ncbi:centromere/kinetochore protein zw10 [Stomoxys calcitrans]|uniref:Centromere/kinetochore protein zw10 n=1 Tax=Stomoxys calcitrans TaxID=35570 RepID=A0A1I8PGZ2_STOCA|nr:centromere/kinetochore protein zw10 [Stomoxys calcitrans]